MNNFLIGLTIKDWFIVVALIALLFLMVRIRRIKKIIAEELLTRLMPEVSLVIEGDIIKDFYLKNYSTSLARNIRIEDINISIDDFGFEIPLKVVFDSVDSLGAADKVRLNYEIFYHGNEADQDAKERYINHILFTDFDCRIHYENIQRKPLCAHIANRKGKFSILEINQYKIK